MNKRLIQEAIQSHTWDYQLFKTMADGGNENVITDIEFVTI